MPEWWNGRDVTGKVCLALFIHFRQTTFIVENEEGQLVAFLLGFLSQTFPDEAYINWIGVHPEYRRQGIARSLYERFFEVARSNGRHRVTCGTSIWNEDSRSWHIHLGFEERQAENTYWFSLQI